MNSDALATARTNAYNGDTGVYNTVDELIVLRESGFLLGGEAEETPRDWTADESAEIKGAYRAGEHRERLAVLFHAECAEVDTDVDAGEGGRL
jgi:hypothetical protein